jgi:hypothetical protein
MNLGTMGGGGSGFDPVMSQIAASGNGESSASGAAGHHAQGQQGGNNMALNAGMISSMAQL